MTGRATVVLGLGIVLCCATSSWAQKTPGALGGTQALPRVTVIGLPDVVADRVVEHLAVSKRFLPVERKALAAALSEQRFGKTPRNTYLDQTLEKAIRDMDKVEGVTVLATGMLAAHNDMLKACVDLGTAVGAQYLILGNIEKLAQTTETTAVPYTRERIVQQSTHDARLRLRIIDVKTATVVGARSFRVIVTDDLFAGKVTDKDSFLDQLSRMAAAAVLDTVFPAQMVRVNPFVISRGSNDGVSPGDRYEIQREGREIRGEGGAVIGRLRFPVGRVEVIEVQDNIAMVRPLEGRDFQVRDLALVTPPNRGEAHTQEMQAPPPLLRGVPEGQLPRIAVGLLRSGSTAAEDKNNMTVFTDTILSRLVQTKRFRIVDRQEVEQLLIEQLAGALEQGRGLKSAMGSLKGADYMLFGSVSVFTIETQMIKLPHSTRTFEQKTGYVEGNLRVVESASGDIKESRKIIIKQNLDETGGKVPSLANLADAFATEAVKALIDAIYPLKVVAVGQDLAVYVNRGSDGGLRKGDRLRAYRPGKPIIDVDSGARLGVEEVEVGEVVIQEVEDARSTAKASKATLLVGDLLKREGAQAARIEGPQVESGKNGTLARPKGTLSSPQKTARTTLAVGTFRIAPGGRTEGASTQLSIVTNELIAKLTNTNRFQVMERQEVDQILDEKAFRAASSGNDVRHALQRLGGADYLIYGEISNFYVEIQQTATPYVNEVRVARIGVGEGTVRIVDGGTGAVVAADTVRLKEALGDAPGGPASFAELTDRFTTEAVSRILGRLFLVSVIGVQPDGTVYLNRGSDGNIPVGTIFDVMRPGKDLIDPQTSVSFGRGESRVGSLEVVAVEASRSRARVLDGQVFVGDVLRSLIPGPGTGQANVMKPAF